MNAYTKIALNVFVLGMFIFGFSFPDWFSANNENSEDLSQREKSSIATIERQETSGHLTSTEATMEKDSITRDHILKF